MRAIHAGEEEFATGDARTLLDSAIEDECLLVTRNYADFTDLATAYGYAGRDFPGILFLPVAGPHDSIPDLAHRVALWLEAGGADAAGNTCCWLDEAEA